MQIEIGRRYLLHRYDDIPSREGILEADEHGALLFRPDGANLQFLIEADGACFGIGCLREIVASQPTLRPAFGHDETEFVRLRKRFETWNFSWCT